MFLFNDFSGKNSLFSKTTVSIIWMGKNSFKILISFLL